MQATTQSIGNRKNHKNNILPIKMAGPIKFVADFLVDHSHTAMTLPLEKYLQAFSQRHQHLAKAQNPRPDHISYLCN